VLANVRDWATRLSQAVATGGTIAPKQGKVDAVMHSLTAKKTYPQWLLLKSKGTPGAIGSLSYFPTNQTYL